MRFTQQTSIVELHDVQGLVRHGYPYFDAAAYLLLEIDDSAATGRWLHQLLAHHWIDTAEVRAATLLDKNATAQERCGVALAFTASGLDKLGLASAMQTFVCEFQEGIAVPHRSRLLGDVEKNCPTRWTWGGPRDRDKLDILLLVYAAPDELDHRVDDVLSIPGCPKTLRDLRSRRGAPGDKAGIPTEPFGFADGISQPIVEGLTTQASGLKRAPMIKAGEFVLGYCDEFGCFPAAPSVAREDDPQRILGFAESGRADFGRNGSYLVMRQLQQDVREFEAMARKDPKLAAQIIGRWPDGSPLTQHPQTSPSEHMPKGHKRNLAELVAENDFGYRRDDPHGFRCPLGSHVRRANPRDSLATLGIDSNRAQQMANRHRLLRRGRPYKHSETKEEGIFFLALNANFERQFEFVQRSWIVNAEFHGMRAEGDPLLGAASAGGTARTLTIQKPWRNECSPGLSDFVTVKGGGYFFMPGMRALRFLAHHAASGEFA